MDVVLGFCVVVQFAILYVCVNVCKKYILFLRLVEDFLFVSEGGPEGIKEWKLLFSKGKFPHLLFPTLMCFVFFSPIKM